MRSLLHHRLAVSSIVFILVLALIAILAGLINPYVLQGYSDALAATNRRLLPNRRCKTIMPAR